MLAQTLRYVGSLVTEPIMRSTLNIACRLRRFRYRKVGSWRFGGPTEFIELVEEANKRLQIEDPGLLKSMTARHTVIYNRQQLFSFPLWKYSGVSDSFTVWKGEGVLAAWIYLYYNSLATAKGRWFLSVPKNAIRASKDAKVMTTQWLKQHNFSSELCEAFESVTTD
jgi:hypothetical protein